MNELVAALLEVMPRAATRHEQGIVSHIDWPKGEVEGLLDRHLEVATGPWRRFLEVRRPQLALGGAAGLIQLALAEPALQGTARKWARGRTLLLSRQPMPTAGACQSVRETPWQPDRRSPFQAGHAGPILAQVTLADGRVATASQDRTVRLWQGEECVQVYDEHWGPVTCLGPWGAGLVSGCLDGCLRRYDAPALTLAAPVVALVARPPLVHAALANGDLETWDLESRELRERRSTGCVPLLVLAEREGQLATAGQDGSIYVNGQVLTGHVGPVRELHFLADGTLRSRGADGRLRDWNLAEPGTAAREGHRGRVVALAAHENRVISAGEDGQLLVWDDRGRLADRLPAHPGPVCCLSEVVGHELLTGSEDGTVRHWNLADGTCRELSVGGRPQQLGWWEPGVPLLVVENDQRLEVVALDRWRTPLAVHWSPPQIMSMEVLPGGEVLVCGTDAEVYLVGADAVREVRHHGQPYVRAVAFPDVVVSVGYHELAVWKLGGELVRKSHKPDGQGHTTRLVRHPHQRLVAVHGLCSFAATLVPVEGKERRRLPGHLEYVLECRFDPSGTHLYSIGGDRTVRVCRVEDGENVATWVADCELTCLAVPVDGQVAVGTAAGEVLRLDLES